MIAVTPCTVQVEQPSRPAETYGPGGNRNRNGLCRSGRPRRWAAAFLGQQPQYKYKPTNGSSIRRLLWSRVSRTPPPPQKTPVAGYELKWPGTRLICWFIDIPDSDGSHGTVDKYGCHILHGPGTFLGMSPQFRYIRTPQHMHLL